MKDNYKEITVEHLQDELEAFKRMWKELRAENKRLKAEAIEDIREIALLEIENKKLKKDLVMYEQLRDQLFGGLEPEDLYEDEDVVKDGNTFLDLEL